MTKQKNISLTVTGSYDSSFVDIVDLVLDKTLRVLEGRREVWLATEINLGRKAVGKLRA
jgi:hypothetical protein